MIGFVQDHLNDFKDQIIIPREFTSAICFGQTGMGKTTGFILPNLEDRIKSGQSVIVYAYKSNFEGMVKALARKHNRLQDIIEIGTDFGESINLLDGATEKQIDIWFARFDSERDNYWNQSAKNLFKAVFESLKIFVLFKKDSLMESFLINYKEIVSFCEINECLSIENLKKLYEDIQRIYQFVCKQKEVYQENFMLLTKIKKLQLCSNLLKEYSSLEKTEPGTGNKGVQEHLKNLISDFAKHLNINQGRFWSNNYFDVGKIVIIYVENLGLMLSNFFNVRLSDLLQKRLELRHFDDLLGVTVFLDEAHKIINVDSIPEVSVCRESRFEYILATQSPNLLYQAIGVNNTLAMLDNIVYKLGFKVDSIEECRGLEKFEYRFLDDSKCAKTQGKIKNPVFIDKDEICSARAEYARFNRIFERFVVYDCENFKKIENISNNAYLIPKSIEHQAILHDDHRVLEVEYCSINAISLDFGVSKQEHKEEQETKDHKKTEDLREDFDALMRYVAKMDNELTEIKQDRKITSVKFMEHARLMRSQLNKLRDEIKEIKENYPNK